MDRISQINVELNQEITVSRFSQGEEQSLQNKFLQYSMMIVLMGAEIESLRSSLRGNSRHREDSKNRSNSNSKAR